MKLIKLEKRNNGDKTCYVAAYKTMFPLDWQFILHLAQGFINEFGGMSLSLAAGKITGENSCSGEDHTEEIKESGLSIKDCESLKTPCDFIRITGQSKTAGGLPLTVWLYNSTDKHESRACVLEIPFKDGNDPFGLFGKDYFTPLLDKIEIHGIHNFFKEKEV